MTYKPKANSFFSGDTVMKKKRYFWMTKEDYEKAYNHCDLGDSCGVRIYFWPHKDMMPYLVKCQSIFETGIETVREPMNIPEDPELDKILEDEEPLENK